MQRALLWLLASFVAVHFTVLGSNASRAADPAIEGVSSRDVRLQAARSLPMNRFSQRTQKALGDVVNNPSFFRRMPTQQIECDPQMLQFLVRRPEVLVNIWELMGITKVSAQRRSSSAFVADDGAGTQCQCDLVFSNDRMHVYYGNGDYTGSMTPRSLKGRCVCVIHTKDFTAPRTGPVVAGTMDVFLKLDNFGADILTRTLGPFVGKTADYNFVETAKFVGQISQLCTNSPVAAQGLAMRLTSVDDSVRKEFAGLAAKIAANSLSAARLPSGGVPGLKEKLPETAKMRLSDSRGSAAPEASGTRQREELIAAEPISNGIGGYFDDPKASDLPADRSEGSQSSEVGSKLSQPPRWIQPQKSHATMRR